eukprot:scaffold1590_cov417-Prasinococcus_capsulatus_cf.AAC.7
MSPPQGWGNSTRGEAPRRGGLGSGAVAPFFGGLVRPLLRAASALPPGAERDLCRKRAASCAGSRGTGTEEGGGTCVYLPLARQALAAQRAGCTASSPQLAEANRPFSL